MEQLRASSQARIQLCSAHIRNQQSGRPHSKNPPNAAFFIVHILYPDNAVYTHHIYNTTPALRDDATIPIYEYVFQQDIYKHIFSIKCLRDIGKLTQERASDHLFVGLNNTTHTHTHCLCGVVRLLLVFISIPLDPKFLQSATIARSESANRSYYIFTYLYLSGVVTCFIAGFDTCVVYLSRMHSCKLTLNGFFFIPGGSSYYFECNKIVLLCVVIARSRACECIWCTYAACKCLRVASRSVCVGVL